MATQIYSTPNHVLVTALKMNGHEAVNMRVAQGKVFWDFQSSDELIEEIERYVEGRCCVDPTHFIARLNSTRDEMFGLLDSHRSIH